MNVQKNVFLYLPNINSRGNFENCGLGVWKLDQLLLITLI